MGASGRTNTNTSGSAGEHPALELAAAVEAAAAGRASGDDRVVEFGRYRLVRTIGRGGMGQVFEAWDTRLERHVALKLVLRGGTRATLDEARCLARLAHPNVVSVHEVGCVDDWGYIAMELVDGPNLRQWLRTGARKRTWKEIVDVILSAARGLAAVHDAGLLHGDVKPGNILIGRDGRVRVADFGLARIDVGVDLGPLACEGSHPALEMIDAELDELVRRAIEAVDAEPILATELDSARALDSVSRFGLEAELEPGDVPDDALAELRALLASRPAHGLAQVGGTLPYMAPERLAGGTGGPAADQYSLCAAAWEALFGEIPKPRGRLARPRWPWRRCPAAIVEVLRRGLELDPDDRYPSMDKLCSALALARDKPNRRSRAWMAVVTNGLAFSLIGVVGLPRDDAERPDATCERAVKDVRSSWGPEQRSQLERRFAASDLPLPRSEARFVNERLDAWVEDWTALWSRACVAEPEVRRCLEHERERFDAVLELLGSGPPGASATLVGHDVASAARTLVTELGSPLGCLDDDRRPTLDAAGIGRLAELSAVERRIELSVLAGAFDQATEQLASFDAMLERLEPGVEGPELALRRLGIEPLRARTLAGLGDVDQARDRLRLALREVETHGHDGLRFALLLEQARIHPNVDDLAMLEGLALRLDLNPVARAELALLRTRVPGPNDHRQLGAALELAEAELSTPHQPERNAELRFELALRRAELYFEAGELVDASNAAEQAWAINRATLVGGGAGLREVLRIAGISHALRGDCGRVGEVVHALWSDSVDPNVGTAAIDATTTVYWKSVIRACPDSGTDLFTKLSRD